MRSRNSSIMLSTLMESSSPSARPICMALPGSLVCTCTFTTSPSLTTTTQSPIFSSLLRKRATALSVQSSLGWDTMNSVQ